jgi:alkanesulfonate monooxygenase SsuD/methylene tetrahydromethanopterin reductase-like flavin-dependent oxidoreductase (luciferase family)
MRIGIASFLSAFSNHGPRTTLDRLVAFSCQVENAGFEGIWVGDAMGRGTPTLDPLIALAALCSVTKSMELGTSVLQVPLREPVELAHRVQTLNVLSKGRLRFGVGAGSTRLDFTLVGANFEDRFKTLLSSVETMRSVWRGEPSNGVVLSPWAGEEAGPPIMLGAWRSKQWINYAAERCAGWIASGLFSKWDDAEAGVRAYREAGGTRAMLVNVPVDLRDKPEYADEWAEVAQISLACKPAIAKDRLRRIEQMGFDDVVLVLPDEDPRHLDMVRALI